MAEVYLTKEVCERAGLQTDALMVLPFFAQLVTAFEGASHR